MGKRSKKQNSPQKPGLASQVDQGKQTEETTAPIQRRQDGTRETIESIVVAFILAFLFRTFSAEAFVIPTGSMAPTLLGRHKDIECDQCKFHFTVGASDEVDSNDQRFRPAQRLKTAFCPNCRYETEVSELLAFKGDRILVTKFQFEIDDPERWQVSVFKYPEDPQTNYIKRVIGLPGETLKIERGDVLARTDDVAGIWQNLRKDDPNKQRALQISVYDNDYPERALHQLGWPERWAPVRRDGTFEGIAGWVEEQDGWQPDTEARSFRLRQASNEDYHWIRYRHIVPAQTDWRQMRAVSGDLEIPAHAIEFNAQPQLITDFCGYNAFTGGHGNRYDPGLFWVGDLTLTCRVDISEVKENAELLLELNEGIRRYRCRIDVNSGQATLVLIDDGLNADEEQVTVSFKKIDGQWTVSNYQEQ